jgi:peptidyl-dipeptidase Dcp
MTDNSFFEAWDGPFGLPTFDRIRPEHFPSAFDRVMAEHNAEIAAITGSVAIPSFANTIEALERAGRLLDRVSRVFFNLESSETNDALEAMPHDYAPKLAQHQTRIAHNDGLFGRIAELYERHETLGLAPDQHRLLERHHMRFVQTSSLAS